MAFRVHHAASYEEYDEYDDNDSYNFNEAGLLVIHLGLDGGRLTYAAHAWAFIEQPDSAGKYHLQESPDTRE